MFSFLFSLLGYNTSESAGTTQNRSSKRARTAGVAGPPAAGPSADQSWLIQCREQSCIQQHQQHQHFMMQQQQHWLRQNWQQQQMNAAGCPLPLPAPPPPVSAIRGHPTGFYNYHQWHPAYFCPPSAVQMRQQQWLPGYWPTGPRAATGRPGPQFQQQQLVNNNYNYKSGPCCPKCFEGKCNQQSVSAVAYPPAPAGQPAGGHLGPVPAQNTTSVRYRSV